MSQIQTEPELTQLLPPPLYFLSIQVDAMREACGNPCFYNLLALFRWLIFME